MQLDRTLPSDGVVKHVLPVMIHVPEMNKHKLTNMMEQSSLAVEAASHQIPQSTLKEPSVGTGRGL